MLKKLANIFLLLYTVAEIKAESNSLLSTLISGRHSSNNQSIEKKYLVTEANNPGIDFTCLHKLPSLKAPVMRSMGHANARFIDLGDVETIENDETEAPAGKLSIMNILPDDDEDEEDEEKEQEGDDNEQVKEEEGEAEEEEEDADYGINFFDYEEWDKLNGTKSESLLKQYHRQNLRMHNLVFPLLLAYKLKFFTVIPLLLGTLVLLVGTTGVAGFFFALFAAALGIRAKSHH